MNICVPVTEDIGIDSPVCGHFGSAPGFIVVDTESGACKSIRNMNLHHQHGMCQPLLSLAGHQIDGIVVGGIGAGALNKLLAGGIRVYLAQQPTVRDAIDAFKAGTLMEVDPSMACGGHGHGHGNGHSCH